VTHLLDTNICIFALKGRAATVDRLMQQDPAALAVSTVSLAELRFGARKSRDPRRMRALQDAFLAPFAVLDFTSEAAEHYADIRHHLERQGSPIGERDQLIASIARANALTLVTNNRREFGRVPDLDVVDWS
jgi:tRNA(fMet)-specific endonuclease VapC